MTKPWLPLNHERTCRYAQTSGVSDKLCNELIVQLGLLCYADCHTFLWRWSCEVASQRHLFSKPK